MNPNPASLTGIVVHGEKLGRTLGFPTTNLDASSKRLPPFGIYAILATVKSGKHTGRYMRCASVGRKPTIGEFDAAIEDHILDFEGYLYGETVKMELVGYLRRERNFPSIDMLVEQVHCDIAMARDVLTGKADAIHPISMSCAP